VVSKRRLVITAVLAGTSQSEVARTYGVSQGWISRLMARYRVEGQSAFEPRSRAPKTHPRATADAGVELVLQLRKQLTEAGLDAGADTIGWHLSHHHQLTLSRATINRILIRHGAVTPDPAKRPKSSYIRFEAEQPNETWQSDFTHYRLTHPDGRPGADWRSSPGSTTTPATRCTSQPMSGSAPRSSCRPSAKPQVSTASRIHAHR
jgi:transposase